MFAIRCVFPWHASPHCKCSTEHARCVGVARDAYHLASSWDDRVFSSLTTSRHRVMDLHIDSKPFDGQGDVHRTRHRPCLHLRRHPPQALIDLKGAIRPGSSLSISASCRPNCCNVLLLASAWTTETTASKATEERRVSGGQRREQSHGGRSHMERLDCRSHVDNRNSNRWLENFGPEISPKLDAETTPNWPPNWPHIGH